MSRVSSSPCCGCRCHRTPLSSSLSPTCSTSTSTATSTWSPTPPASASATVATSPRTIAIGFTCMLIVSTPPPPPLQPTPPSLLPGAFTASALCHLAFSWSLSVVSAKKMKIAITTFASIKRAEMTMACRPLVICESSSKRYRTNSKICQQHTCVNALMNGFMYGLVSDSITSVTIATKTTKTVVSASVRQKSTAHVKSSRRIMAYTSMLQNCGLYNMAKLAMGSLASVGSSCLLAITTSSSTSTESLGFRRSRCLNSMIRRRSGRPNGYTRTMTAAKATMIL
mmetsp:Transcript_21874/g.39184  ORF Transcript_21874/g.39184 Transcript_21874/m.39184 type:complete len:283 (-) Transcript_21874:513-1361(-)